MDNIIQAHVYFSDSEEIQTKKNKDSNSVIPDLYIHHDIKIKNPSILILTIINPVAELAFLTTKNKNYKLTVCNIKKMIAIDFTNDIKTNKKYFYGYINYFFSRINRSKKKHRKALYTVIIFDMIFKNRTIINDIKQMSEIINYKKLKKIIYANYNDCITTALIYKKDIICLYNIWHNEIKKEFNIDIN